MLRGGLLALRPSITRGLPLSGEDPSISGCFNIAFKKLSMVFTTYGSHGFFSYYLGFLSRVIGFMPEGASLRHGTRGGIIKDLMQKCIIPDDLENVLVECVFYCFLMENTMLMAFTVE